MLTGAIDASLLRGFDDLSFDGTLIALELVPAADQFPDIHSRTAVLDTDDGSLDYVDTVLPGADVRTRDASISSDGRYVAVSAQIGELLPDMPLPNVCG